MRGTRGCFLIAAAAIAIGLLGAGQASAQSAKLPAAVFARARPLAAKLIALAFSKLDSDANQQLSLEEFLKHPGSKPAVSKRDFQLFDHDANKSLELDEFSAIPTVAKPEHRGGTPDPLLALVEQTVAAMDKSFDDWEKNPEIEINVNQFLQSFVSTIGGNLTVASINQADINGDRRISRAEARRFIEIQLGVRRDNGRMLREPSGRVCNFMLYRHIDVNKNDKLERGEFLERSYTKEKGGDIFDKGDLDGDDALSFDEWRNLPTQSHVDPIIEFRRLDVNLDAHVDPRELATGVSKWRKVLSESVFPGFDMDQDGKLTLYEYRMTMLANPVLKWHRIVTDPNSDGKLSLKEFSTNETGFPLLRFIYFSWLDLNEDNSLSPDEFTFKIKEPDRFYVMNADGDAWRELFEFKGHPACGSPAVSPDGKSIAFDAWPLNRPGLSAVHIMTIDGENPRKLCLGGMPSWSKDGQFLTCQMKGVKIFKNNGVDFKLAHETGRAAQWSPDGKKIAFLDGSLLKTYDVESEAIQKIFDKDEYGYRMIYWNMAWSPDSKFLCLKAVKENASSEIVIVSASGKGKPKVRYSIRINLNADFAWHPNGDRIVFSMYCSERQRLQLYEFNPNNDDAPKLVAGQDKTSNNTDICWTPDGKRLIVVSGDY